MSFNLCFHARNPKDATAKVKSDKYLPQPVKDFLLTAISGIPSECGVQVAAIGHLYNGDYNVSTAQISVHPLVWVESEG